MSAPVKIFSGKCIYIKITFASERTFAFITTINDNCSEFNEVEIKSNQFFSYFVFNREKIKNEEVKRFQATEIIGKDTLLLTVSTDHACHAKLTIFEGNRRIDKVIDYHNLSAATTGDKNKSEININYTYNNALKLVEWDKKIKEIVTDLGKKKSFVRK